MAKNCYDVMSNPKILVKLPNTRFYANKIIKYVNLVDFKNTCKMYLVKRCQILETDNIY